MTPSKRPIRSCQKCGARLRTPADVTRCDECGTPMCPECDSRDPWGLCPQCGGFGWPLQSGPGNEGGDWE